MTLLDVFLGDSALLRAQEQALIEQEDRVFQAVEGEHWICARMCAPIFRASKCSMPASGSVRPISIASRT